MPFFIRSIIGIVLVVSLSLVAGCVNTPFSNKPTTQTSAFPWQKPKEPERAQQTTMAEVLSRPAVTRL